MLTCRVRHSAAIFTLNHNYYTSFVAYLSMHTDRGMYHEALSRSANSFVAHLGMHYDRHIHPQIMTSI